jgi:hypothetical protein
MAPRLPLRVFPLTNTSKEVCYINVVLQCLRYVIEISNRIFSYNGKSESDRAQLARADIVYDTVMTELRKIFRREIGDVEGLRCIDNFLPRRMQQGHQDSLDLLDLLLSAYLVDAKSLFEFTETAYYYCGGCDMVCYALQMQ